jgi:hypothetical protein
MAAENCVVCGRALSPVQAHRRIEIGGDTFLVCCPLCLDALGAGEVQRRMMPDSFSDDRIDVLVEYCRRFRSGAIAPLWSGLRRIDFIW